MIQTKTLLKIAAPLLSIFILINGLGALATFIPIQINAGGGSAFDVGIITGAYYLGMALFGTLILFYASVISEPSQPLRP